MAKSRNFSVRAQAMSALLAEFPADKHVYAFVGTDLKRDYKALWDCAKSANMFYHGGHFDLSDASLTAFHASMTAFDGNSSINKRFKRKLLVTYNRRRTQSHAEVLTVFTCRGNILGFVVVSDDGHGAWFGVDAVEESSSFNVVDMTAYIRKLADHIDSRLS